jgi:hypothetical protein
MEKHIIQVCLGRNLGLQGLRGPGHDHSSAMHDGDQLAEMIRFLHVVGRHENRRTEAVAQVPQVLPHRVAGHWIKPDCGFIQEKNRGPVQHGLRNLQAPNHAAGIGPNQRLARFAQVHEVQSVQDSRLPLAPWDAIDPSKEQQVFVPGESAVGGEHLRDVPDNSPDLYRVLDDVEASHPRLSGARRKHRREHFDGGRLARTIWAEQAEDAAGRYR